MDLIIIYMTGIL